MLKGCPKCEQWKEEIELCKTKLQDLENDSALLEEMNCSITNEIAELSWDQDLFTMREVCHSIEEHICHQGWQGRWGALTSAPRPAPPSEIGAPRPAPPSAP